MIEKLGKNRAKLTVSIGSGRHRKRFSRTVEYSNARELRKMYSDFEAECTRNPYTDMKVCELVESYIKYKKTLGIKQTTLHGYTSAYRRIDKAIGDIRAKNLTAFQVEDFIADLSDELTPKSIINTVGLLNASYNRAVRTGQLPSNPCAMATIPKKKKPEIVTFSLEEMHKFWNLLDTERLDYKVGYGLCLFCGLRRSEVLGLREEDINIPFKAVTVRETRHQCDGMDFVQDTKTEQSHRTLAIPDILIDAIEELIEQHHAIRYEHTDYIVQDGFGQPLSPSTFSKHINIMEEDNDLPHVTVHGLRHTFASLLNSSGVDIARISRELGHSNIGTTMNIYTHVFGDVSASSRGIADIVNATVVTADSNLPLEEIEKAL